MLTMGKLVPNVSQKARISVDAAALGRGGGLVHDVPCVGHEIVLVVVAFDVEVAAILHGGHWGHGHTRGEGWEVLMLCGLCGVRCCVLFW